MIYYGALAASIALNSISLVLMKAYAVSNADRAGIRLRDVRVLICVVLYGFAAVFWVTALVGVDLMIAYPSLALTYVVIGLVSRSLFGEELSRGSWAGLLLIAAGVLVMNV